MKNIININDIVRVTLTKKGVDVLAKNDLNAMRYHFDHNTDVLEIQLCK